MIKVPSDAQRRKRNLSLVLPSTDDPLTPGCQRTSLALRPSEKARLRELTAALNRRAEGRRIYTMSSVIRYALDCLYVDIMDVAPDIFRRNNNDEKEGAQ